MYKPISCDLNTEIFEQDGSPVHSWSTNGSLNTLRCLESIDLPECISDIEERIIRYLVDEKKI